MLFILVILVFIIASFKQEVVKGRFRVHQLVSDSTWSARCNNPKTYCYSNSSTQWTLVSLIFTAESYRESVFDEIDKALSDMCFSNNTIPHFVY